MFAFLRLIYSIFCYIFFLPFIIAWKIAKSNVSQIQRWVGTVVSLAILFPLWTSIQLVVFFLIWNALPMLGLRKIVLPTAGPSMLPTLSEQSILAVNVYGSRTLIPHIFERGDIVVFSNKVSDDYLKKEKKATTGLVKRVIGVPGDRVMIKDGFVYLAGEITEEPYILKARSTFGGDSVRDCQEVDIPPNQLMVLGDNRKQSADSRHLGLIKISDVSYYRSVHDQQEFMSRWRDASHDKEAVNSVTFDEDLYLTLLNEKRKEIRVQPVKLQGKLTQSAQKRAQVILKFDDLSFQATRSGYTMEKALNEVGYSNIVWGEAAAFGYYDAQELLNHYFEFPDSRKFLLEGDFGESGVAAVMGETHGCPTQAIVQHFAGYKPPNYKKEDIQSWKKAVENLDAIIPGWEEAQKNPQTDRNAIVHLVEILKRQRDISSGIASTMASNRWLSRSEEDQIKEFERLAKESAELSKSINESR